MAMGLLEMLAKEGIVGISVGYRRTTSGGGLAASVEDAARALGVVNQKNVLWDHLSCRDHLCLFARLRGVDIEGDARDGTIGRGHARRFRRLVGFNFEDTWHTNKASVRLAVMPPHRIHARHAARS